MNYKLMNLFVKKMKKSDLLLMIDSTLSRAIRYYDDYAIAIIFAKETDKEVIEHLVNTVPLGGLMTLGGTVLDCCDIGKDGLYPPNIELFFKLRTKKIESKDWAPIRLRND